jgi:hypothetical protein
MPFELYRAICIWLLEDGSAESIFAHCFLTTTWNLMCRSINTVHIMREHMGYVADSMLYQFATTKRDKLGKLSGQKRHTYANADMPEICHQLSLGRYVIAFPGGATGLLFPGKSQYDRFRQILRRVRYLTTTLVRCGDWVWTRMKLGCTLSVKALLPIAAMEQLLELVSLLSATELVGHRGQCLIATSSGSELRIKYAVARSQDFRYTVKGLRFRRLTSLFQTD